MARYEQRPRPTQELMRQLRRVAHWLDQMAEVNGLTAQGKAQRKARANICTHAAARLELLDDIFAPRCVNCNEKAPQEDDYGVPLCDACYAGLDS